jgi:hypothetical protein
MVELKLSHVLLNFLGHSWIYEHCGLFSWRIL